MPTLGSSVHLDVLEEDPAASLVLQLHQFLSMFPLLVRLVKKILGEVLQSHIVAVKVVRLKVERKHVRGGLCSWTGFYSLIQK